MDEIRRTARAAGWWYLGLAIAGGIGFLLIRPMIHVPDDPAATARNVAERAAFARLGIVAELAVVVTQALAALWFYRLFRSMGREFDATSIAAFGLVNAVILLASAAFLSTAVAVADAPALAPGGDVAATIQLLYELSAKCWEVGGVFFGLWLIPMGRAALASGRMPKALGWILIAGGGGYVASTLVVVGYAGTPTWLVSALTIPATVGEFWMIGFLVFVGVRPGGAESEGAAPRT